ncbi:hypothetical protein GWN42_13650 [candidate division KSB1 bacterium]|nr:hypothetical protein [candidate division KSB1 bacterium]
MGKKIQISPNDPTATLRSLCLWAVLTQGTDSKTGRCALNETEKFERYEFAKKIKEATVKTDFSVEEIAELKKCVGGLPEFGPMIVGPIFDILEGKGKK